MKIRHEVCCMNLCYDIVNVVPEPVGNNIDS